LPNKEKFKWSQSIHAFCLILPKFREGKKLISFGVWLLFASKLILTRILDRAYGNMGQWSAPGLPDFS
jgi:hypothetical protein